MDDRIRDLAEGITSLLTGGIQLHAEVMHYLDSALGITTPDMFSQLIESPSCETESILELVFFPDQAQQILLEPILERHVFREADIEEAAEFLAGREIKTKLIFPEGAGIALLPMSQAPIRQFIRRLRIERTIDPRVTREIEGRYGEPGTRYRLRVAIRNARFEFSDEAVEFLNRFLSGTAGRASDFLPLFAFCCETLERKSPGGDIYGLLMSRKRQCAETIRQTLKCEQQLSRQPVEALIMKGISISCMNIDEAKRQIGWIDRISLAVFGKTEVIDYQLETGIAPHRDLGVFEKSAGEIDKIIRILS